MADEPAPLSERIETLSKQFGEVAAQIRDASSGLATVALHQRMEEFRVHQNQLLKRYVDDLSAVNGHDVIFLLNRSKPMGEGYHSALAAGARAATDLYIASGTGQGRDLSVSLYTWDKDSRGYGFGGNSNIEKIYDKAGSEEAAFAPLVRDILSASTPDKLSGRPRHYVVISSGAVTDSVENSVQMLASAMTFDPRLTVDFVTVGAGEGNIRDLRAQLAAAAPGREPGLYTAEKPDDIQSAVIRALKTRLKALPAAVEPPPPAKEPPREPELILDAEGPPVSLAIMEPAKEQQNVPAAAPQAKPKKGLRRLWPW
jgi:hypothetical protein